jgi:hypothetical protein
MTTAAILMYTAWSIWGEWNRRTIQEWLWYLSQYIHHNYPVVRSYLVLTSAGTVSHASLYTPCSPFGSTIVRVCTHRSSLSQLPISIWRLERFCGHRRCVSLLFLGWEASARGTVPK